MCLATHFFPIVRMCTCVWSCNLSKTQREHKNASFYPGKTLVNPFQAETNQKGFHSKKRVFFSVDATKGIFATSVAGLPLNCSTRISRLTMATSEWRLRWRIIFTLSVPTTPSFMDSKGLYRFCGFVWKVAGTFLKLCLHQFTIVFLFNIIIN